MNYVCLCESEYTTCSRSPWGPEVGIRSPGVKAVKLPDVGAGTETESSTIAVSAYF